MTTILIIDKNGPFRKALSQMIDLRIPGIRIINASDSAAGLEKMKVFHPPLVFIDTHLPVANTPEYIHILKHIHPPSTIIAFTSYHIPEYQAAMEKSGVDLFLPKDTWTGEYLLRLVESVVSAENNDGIRTSESV